jgi:hypothetical protein
MDPLQVAALVCQIILNIQERDKAILESLPPEKRAEMALAQYEDWKRWRDFLALFHPKA